MSERLLKEGLAENSLAEILNTCPEVTRYDSGDLKEAWALANMFSDCERFFGEFQDVLLPKLVSGKLTTPEIFDTLLEVREVLDGVLFHLQVSKFYADLRLRFAEDASE